MVSGAVFLEKPVVDPLTPYVPLMLSMDANNMKFIAQLLWALERGFDNLREYYDKVASSDLQLDKSITFQWFFPKNTVIINGKCKQITYIKDRDKVFICIFV